MRWIKILVLIFLCSLWVLALNKPWGSIPALGKLLHPQWGFWSNASSSHSITQLSLPEKSTLQPVTITFNDRMVPIIAAKNDHDLYLAQGYIHAYFRLWQIDMQSRAAGGRISEVVGSKSLEYDRNQRRKGMLWAAENSLKAMEKDSLTYNVLNAYTQGVNLFIEQLKSYNYPLEYKLMGFAPEPWTNLKTVLILKLMADDLTGNVDDIAMSYLSSNLDKQKLDYLFPERDIQAQPVIPATTVFDPPSLSIPYTPSGIVFADFKLPQHAAFEPTDSAIQEPSGIGSNNWAVSAQRTADSSTILCNDPHLSLNLPAIWFEQQLTAPGIRCYGVSIPGTPGVIIGFNDSISWGVTNNYRDVKDYYEIVATNPLVYQWDNKSVPFNFRYEAIKIKGEQEPFIDTIKYTIHGPVQYDGSFPEPSGSGKMLATTWMGHKGTNELRAVYLYNRAQNYEHFVQAIHFFECPAQNFAYADAQGNVAIWGQGRFVNRWKNQGKYVMRGDISTTLWRDTIPMHENPHAINPMQGYVASANQTIASSLYPYWYNGYFTEWRSWEINQVLHSNDTTDVIRLANMKNLQQSNYSLLANNMDSLFQLASKGKVSWEKGNGVLDADSKTASLFQIWWHYLYRNLWDAYFNAYPIKLYPSAERTVALLTQPLYAQDSNNPVSSMPYEQIAAKSWQQMEDSIQVLEKSKGIRWYQVKNTTVSHLAKIAAFSYETLHTGGWGNTVNAMKQNHGPSWRMVVQFQHKKPTAYVVYPGGQSGNPGSKHYGSFIADWAAGNYYTVKLQ
jgi:penicillin amidase